jgi:hypothetical protein
MQVETNQQQVTSTAGPRWLHVLAVLIWFWMLIPAVEATTGRVSQISARSPDGRSTFQAQYLNETQLVLRLETKNNLGETLNIFDCATLGGFCNIPNLNGVASYSYTLVGFDPRYHEIVSETCGGVVSTGQLGCTNAAYEARVKMRLGRIVIRNAFVPEQSNSGSFGLLQAGMTPKLTFADYTTKYFDRFGYGGYMPAGRYTLSGVDRQWDCLPVQTDANKNEVFEVPADGTVTFTVVYRRTQCLITVDVDSSYQGVTPYSLTGLSFNCPPVSQGTAACTARANYNATFILGASVPSGFSWKVGGCGTGKPPCNLTADQDNIFKMSIFPSAAPPPPPPTVTLSIQGGAQSPSNTEIAKGATDVPLVQLRLTPQDGSARLDSLSLAASGTGRDDLDLNQLRLVLDANANGQFDAGETVLASGSFSADNGSMTFVLGTPLVVSTTTHVLVVADVDSTVTTAGLWLGGGASLIMLGALGLPGGFGGAGGSGSVFMRVMRRLSARRRTREKVRLRLASLSVLVLSTAMLASCGGTDQAIPVNSPAPAPSLNPPPLPQPAPPPPPNVVTYQVRVTAARAVDATTPTTVISVSGLPISGATISVQP